MALAGADVTVLEARRAGGSFAASAGSSRVLRFEYGDVAHYTDLVLRARTQWRELERLLDERLFDETGMLWFAIELSQYVHDSFRTCEAAGLAVRMLEPSEARREFPAFSVEGVAAVLHDAECGVLHARRATLGMARLASAAGVKLREDVRIRAIGDGTVELADGTSERADQVLVATGAWTGGLLGAPIRSTQQANVYLRIATPGLPVWTYDMDVYGLGDDDGAGLKVGGHVVGPDIDPDDPAGREAPAEEIQRLTAAARRRLSGLDWPEGGAPLRGADVCCYALTPTEAPIVARVSEHTVVCAGFSGHGFKFAPTVAAAAGDLVLGRTPEIDLSPFAYPEA
jgi:sarcosine oxidase/N-methyl-L-tryptophan oxidase